MPTVANPQKATARVVVLLKPSEKKRLAKLAEAEQVSAAEIIRRSLDAYVPEAARDNKQLVRELNTALDETLASISETRGRIAEALAKLERQRTPPEVDARLNELYQRALVEQANGKREATKTRKRKAA